MDRPMTQTKVIELEKVVKTYKTKAGTFAALQEVNIQVISGEFVAVVGKSGSGKSTLLNMIAGIDRPDSGKIIVANTPVLTLSEGKMAVWRGKHIGVVFQFFQLLPTLTAIENMMLPMDFCNVLPTNQRKQRAFALLDQVGLSRHVNKLPEALSGGEQQRVAIARALANDPPIIVADEPTGNLDSQNSESVLALFGDLVNEGKTIVMVTHERNPISQVSRTVMIDDGKLQQIPNGKPIHRG